MSTSGNNEENPSRKGKGRRKVTMAKMENESNLQVTFSKRRHGLFKKASELSIRCGSETALVVFSPGDKPYSFGHPNVETVTTRFLGENDHNAPPAAAHELRALEAERQMIADSTAELNQAMDQLDLAKNQAKELDQIVKQIGKIKHMKEFNFQQLDQLQGEVFDFKNKLETKDGRDKSLTAAPYNFPGPNPDLGTSTNFQLVERPATGSSFDPLFGSSQQGLPNQFHHCYGSGGINSFGYNVPGASLDPPFAGTWTTNFLAPLGYNIPMWNAGSSFVVPYTAENETSDHVTGNDSGGAHKDGDE